MLKKLTQLSGEDLMPDEKVSLTAFASWYVEIKQLMAGGILTLASISIFVYSFINQSDWVLYLIGAIPLFLAFPLVIRSVFSHYSVRYFMTTFRVIKRTGILSKNINYVPYAKIQNIKIKKSISERIVDMGDILIDVAGSSGVEMRIDNVRDPEKIHNLILGNMKKKENKGNGL